MNKRWIPILVVLLTILSALTTPVHASNTQSTSYTVTYTINEKTEISQDAYLPSGTYLDLGLNQPTDLFIVNDVMYIADKGNKQIVVVDLKLSTAFTVGKGILSQPTGVAADNNGKIYVADVGKDKAYRFDKDGNLEFTFDKPTTPNFGKSQGFRPSKIAPADDGGVYIVSEGNIAGIIHMNGTGDFLGYFASNNVVVDLFQRLQDFFLTDDQKKTFLNKTPPSFGNIHRGYDGLVYSINRGRDVNVKKHSINGLDLFSDSQNRYNFQDPVDICVTEDGRIYGLHGNGRITELTYDGYTIATFGGSSNKADRIGLFEIPAGIGVDSKNNIYVLDEQRAFIQVFSPTPVQSNIHRALNAYNNGMYQLSKELWEDVLKFNNVSFLAHLYMGRTYLQETDYEKAIEHFGIAKVKDYYSVAYWETRNIWLQENMSFILLFLIVIYVLLALYKIISKRVSLFSSFKAAKSRILDIPIINDITKLKYMLRHPVDNSENIKYNTTGSYTSASIIYGMLFIVLVLSQIASGFIFSINIVKFSFFNTLLYYSIIMGLFIVGNYFISAINDGNGTLKAIYVGTAYCFAPAVLFMPFVIIFCNFATLNEGFLISASMTVIIAWCMLNILLMIIEIHEYTFKQAVFNILMTLFFMGVAVLAASFAYLLINQVWAFILKLITEAMLRAKAF